MRLSRRCSLALSTTVSMVLVSLSLLAVPSLRAQQNDFKRVGLPQDWSHRHLIYRGSTSPEIAARVQSDPRVLHNWLARTRAHADAPKPARSVSHDRGGKKTTANGFHVDWSMPLGANLNVAMFPAKYSFDINAAPDCTNDFVVYTISINGAANHANIAAFNRLYTGGTGSGDGFCSGATTPTAYWGYNIPNAHKNNTSPVLSLDGTKVAFADDNNPPAFHVLAWKANDGTVNLPSSTALLVTNAPVAGATAQYTSLSYGNTGNILSSPYVDYAHDTAYVGDESGKLFRIKNVFCTTSACAQSTPQPAPSLDTTWNSTGSVTLGGTCTGGAGTLSAPVQDPVTGDVFVGCGDGKLYGFNSSGTALTGSPITVGNGTAKGGVDDGPMVDSSHGFVYAFSGDNGTNAIVVQVSFTSSSMSLNSTATVGKNNVAPLHLGAFNDAFWSNADKSSWLLYVCASDSTGKFATLYGVGFNSITGAMNSGTPTNAYTNTTNFSNKAEECSPVTEFPYNGTDRLFVGLLGTGSIFEFDIGATTGSAPNPDTSTFPSSTNAPNASAAETGGTSGIVIDNVSTVGEAHSIYFSSIGGNTAVKLTQNTLQ